MTRQQTAAGRESTSRAAGRLSLLIVLPLLLGSCEQQDWGQHIQNARQALAAFCALKRIDIISNALLTEQQRQAGAIVCQAVGMGLGS